MEIEDKKFTEDEANNLLFKLNESIYNRLVATGRIKEAMKMTGFKYKPWKRICQINSSDKLSLTKIHRNELCSCNSGKKVKHCCGVTTKYSIKKDKDDKPEI